ncbi:cyclic peptide export ABC transporter [Cognatishimia sp. F0-27]|uniref:cyclic peptide export ABC transporter n=1 Tax=Cognatishimia sp. F0-27 TaxID=2816855 RepID=UPI001E039D0A|nr:cyclic peptide export ABC transporter [Cognatishimia sp. F0-27]
MPLIQLLRTKDAATLRWIVVLTLISGAANAALVALINAGAAAVYSSESATQQFLLFIACLTLFLYTKMHAEIGGKMLFDDAMTEQRLRIVDKLLKARVSSVETMRESDVITRSSRNIGQVIQASDTIVYGLQSMFMLVFCFAYLFTISPAAFGSVLVGLVLVAVYRHMRNEDSRNAARTLIARESQISEMVSETFLGFKEVKLNDRRRADLHAAYDRLVAETSAMAEAPTRVYIQSRAIIQGVFYIIIAAIVFVIPRMTNVYAFDVLEITAVVLFIIGYLAGFLDIIPVIGRTNAALTSLSELEAELDAGAEPESVTGAPLAEPEPFDGLTLSRVRYAYREPDGSAGFAIGPIDLSIEKGRVLFVVGGNGSGKSTLIKLICGLYQRSDGAMTLNGRSVETADLPRLRRSFSLIMSDFHLFDRLYGYHDSDPARVDALIDKMQLGDKVSFADGRFSTQTLSTGQRKRLALIVAILEDRDVYIFDEWAADQDPQFRRYFYETLMAELRAEGKTVIAVTHDDAYLHCADAVLRLDYGQMVAARAATG